MHQWLQAATTVMCMLQMQLQPAIAALLSLQPSGQDPIKLLKCFTTQPACSPDGAVFSLDGPPPPLSTCSSLTTAAGTTCKQDLDDSL